MFQKITYLVFLLSIAIVGHGQQQSYTIKGTIAPSYDGKQVYLQILNEKRNGLIDIDSTMVSNGQFSFKRNDVSDTQIRFVSTETPMVYAPALFIPEPGLVELSIGDTIVVNGTPLNKSYQKFVDNQYDLNKRIQSIADVYKARPQTGANYQESVELMKPIIEEMAQARYQFAKENIQNELGEFITLASFEILPGSRILELISQMRPEFRNSALGKEVIAYYTAEAALEPGNKYKDITLRDPLGNEVKLSDYIGKNKVVLLDFWASWCGPCIKEMPTVAEAYEKYKPKGLEIVGVSLDDKQESWLRSIERLNIVWPQMSDLKGWKSDAVGLYGVNSIPFTLLFDADGAIIASGLRGDELIRKIGELLD